MRCRRTSGFTLVEVLVVVAILGIVGTATLAYVGGRGDLKVAAAARRFVASAQYAQNLAIARRQPHFIVTTDDSVSVCVRSSGAWVAVPHPAGAGLLGIELGGDVVRTDATWEGMPVYGYDETGQPFLSDNGGSLRQALVQDADMHLASGEHEITVYVEPVTGTLKIE